MPTVPPLARLVAAGAAAALLAGGCGGIQERKARADLVVDSVDKARAAGTARLSVSNTVEVKLDGRDRLAASDGAGGGSPLGGPGAGRVPPRTATAEADLRRGRTAYVSADGDGTPRAVRIYSGTTIYARRAGEQGRASRPWVHLDLTSIDPDEIDNDVELAEAARRIGTVQGIDNPLFLLQLLRGTLAGSIERAGEEQVGGVATTHFRLNIDREKAFKDEPEDVQDAHEALFKTMFATKTVFPGEVWLDADGLPRRWSVTFQPQVRRRALADLRLTVELSGLGEPVQISLPGPSETARVDGLGALAEAVTGAAA